MARPAVSGRSHSCVARTAARWPLRRRRRRRRRGRLLLLAALALLVRRALPWPALAHHGVRHRVRVRHELVLCLGRRWLRLFLRLRLGLAVVTVTTFLRLGLAVLTATTFVRLGWRWHRPHLRDDDLLHDLPGLAPDLLAELLGVKFPAHHHHLLLLLVLELYLLDAELLCVN